MLSFIGTGSAFNTKLGNNGAYLKSPDGKTLFMIDCGELTFDRLQKYKVLDGVENLHVLITHFHPDHVGSLGSLVFYMYYKDTQQFPTVTIYTPDHQSVENLFKLVGVTNRMYNMSRLTLGNERNLVDFGEGIGRVFILPVRTEHDPKLKVCYGYRLEFVDQKGKVIYYSGDSSEIPPAMMRELISGRIDLFYQDTTSKDYEGNVHLSLNKLNAMIPYGEGIRTKIHCMHVDPDWDETFAAGFGFKTVQGPK